MTEPLAPPRGSSPAGMESVNRIATLLRTLAAGRGQGVRLSTLATVAGLSRGTTHRLLAALCAERLARRDAATRQYSLGDDIPLLAWSAVAESADIRELGRPAVRQLAEITGDTAYLAIRFGFESVCVDRRFGAHPIKVLTIDVGSHRPLGVGAGALAMLAGLPDREVVQIVSAVSERLKAFPAYAPGILPRLIAETRARGYSLSDGQIAEGVRGIGIAVLGRNGLPCAALSVAATSTRMSGNALNQAAAALTTQKHALERAISGDATTNPAWRKIG